MNTQVIAIVTSGVVGVSAIVASAFSSVADRRSRRLEADAERFHEHQMWVRDQRLTTYADLVRIMEVVTHHGGPSTPENPMPIDPRETETVFARAELISSPEVRRLYFQWQLSLGHHIAGKSLRDLAAVREQCAAELRGDADVIDLP